LLVGLNTSDDAGVYRLREDLALVQTLDFFTPVVDDPYIFGQVAAANALSDVYAMGARPLTAMNIVGFPVGKIDMSVLAEILRGGADKVKEAGAVLIGGHSIHDNEPKYGLSVTGVVHPDKVLTNAGAKPGDVLILTKPIGIGIITTAIKRGVVPQEVIDVAVNARSTLNNKAAEAIQEVGVSACTDVTGFGLLGHAGEIAKASKVGMEIWSAQVPIIKETWDYVAQNIVPGGTRANLQHLEQFVTFGSEIDTNTQLILADAITSGGLLISVPEEKSTQLQEALQRLGTLESAVIGKVTDKNPGKIAVV
jgi:selenide, water dikinase